MNVVDIQYSCKVHCRAYKLEVVTSKLFCEVSRTVIYQRM